MSSANKLGKFFQALDKVNQVFTCALCSEICKNAITLSTCFHMICAEHFEGLKNCPKCNSLLDGCKTFINKEINDTIARTKDINEIFKPHRSSAIHSNVNRDTPSLSYSEYNEALLEKENIANIDKRPTRAAKNIGQVPPNPSDSKVRKTLNDTDQIIQENSTITESYKVRTRVAKNVKPISKQTVSEVTNDTVEKKGKTASRTTKNVEKSDSKNSGAKASVSKIPENNPKIKLNIKKRTTSNENLNTSISSLKLNKTLEKRNTKGETALHIACRVGNLDKVIELLNQGANTNTKDHAGWTPLHEAVQNGQLHLVKLLLQHNALINVPGQSNETPLHEAIRYGHEDIIKELVMHGADIDIRNIKGETPADLAKGKLKAVLETAADNIIFTQSVNITHISNMHSELDYEDIKVFCVSQYRSVLSKLKTLMKHNENLHVEPKFTKNVTHLLIDTEDDLICTSTLDVLQAITNELWIISSNWINDSTEEYLEPFEKYEVVGVGKDTYNGPKRARFNKYKQLPRLFNGCHFYLHNFTTKYEISKHIILTKAILTKLITDAGGVALRRVPNPESIPDAEKLVPYHARKDGMLVDCSHYIIFKDMYEPRYNMKHLKALPVGWLIECIEKYELCDP